MKRWILLEVTLVGFAIGQSSTPPDLTNASLEQLMDLQVTSVAKRGERLSKTAASVYVITSEDIRRSGLHSLPEVLRLAPGVQVARTSAGAWAISIRGFNDEYANKLLVLVDGRRVYSELFSGVFWDGQQMALDNIERIEVIRGPVAALWGINAVNGVINIITNNAEVTQGGRISAESGTAGERNFSARFGGSIGSKAAYRLGVRDSGADQFHAPNGAAPVNGWSSEGADFRVDWNPTPSDNVIISGQAYYSTVGHRFLTPNFTDPLAPPSDLQQRTSSGSLLMRWEHSLSEQSSAEGQFSWEHTNFADPQLPLSFDIVDFELKEHTSIGSRHDLIAGVDLRAAFYNINSTPTFAVRPGDIDTFVGSVFVEDEITLVPDRIELIGGVNFSHNGFTGVEIQPTARLLWTPNRKSSTWIAVSRAVRTPAVYHRGLNIIASAVQIQPGMFAYPQTLGTAGDNSEAVLAYEAGERLQPSKRLSVDVSMFYNGYSHLETATVGMPVYVPPTTDLPGYLSLPAVLGNRAAGQTFGGDVSAAWTVNRRWKVAGGYSELRSKTWSGIALTQSLPVPDANPAHQFQVHSAVDVTRKWQIDAGVYYTSNVVSTLPIGQVPVPSHTRGDLRVGWRPGGGVEVSAGVQDAFAPLHLEFLSTRFDQSLEVRRNIYGAFRWQF